MNFRVLTSWPHQVSQMIIFLLQHVPKLCITPYILHNCTGRLLFTSFSFSFLFLLQHLLKKGMQNFLIYYALFTESSKCVNYIRELFPPFIQMNKNETISENLLETTRNDLIGIVVFSLKNGNIINAPNKYINIQVLF